MEKVYILHPSPVGPLTIAESGGEMTYLLFGGETPEGYVPGESPVLRLAAGQLDEYFAGGRREFDLPLRLSGTKFQMKVWAALREIPYGETRSYRDIAVAAGCPRGFRAVGMANHRNPISIIVPCHRVVGTNGSLTGYGGGLDVKEKLLELERKFS